jgi:sulfur-oxidizing protein SoxY
MKPRFVLRELSRRRCLAVMAAAPAAAVFAGLAPLRTLAQQNDEATTVEEAIARIVGDKKIGDGSGLINLDLPQIAENGNTVPLAVSVDSPMTEDDRVTAVHIFADGNPRPDVVTFHFTEHSGAASASTRMRLAKTQNVIAVAELSDGRVLRSQAEVKVTIGGCGG